MNARESGIPASTDWLARLAHDLRGPLTPMRMAVSMLQSDGVSTQRVQELARAIDRQIGQLAQLADELNDVLSISRGNFRLQLAQYDLGTIIGNAVDHVSRQGSNAGTETRPLEIHAPAEPVLVRADEVRLTQLIAQLLGDLRPAAAGDSERWIQYQRDGDRAIVRLRDSTRSNRRNAGLDYVATGSHSMEPDKLGMLPIIGREIAIAHGAVISVGDGSGDVVLTLPLAIA
jgi:K+-sensing histidine kinase KdpD